MKAILVHAAFENTPVEVAVVDVADMKGMEALEYVYRATQNIEGSWSKGPAIEWKGQVHNNPDFNPNITVTTTLKTNDEGDEYGLRSTSVGDYVKLGDELFRVASMGFKPADEIQTREYF